MKFMGNTCEKAAPRGVGAGCLLAPTRTDMAAQLVDDHDNDQDEAKKGAKALDHAKVTITNCSMQSTHVIVMRRTGIFGHGGIKDTHDK